MPHIVILDAAGTSQRRLLYEEQEKWKKQGYLPGGLVQDGTTWQDLLASGATRGLFSEKNYLVVEEAEKLGKFPEALCGELESSPGNTVLLLLYKKSWGGFLPPPAKKACVFRKAESFPRWGRERIEGIRKKASEEGLLLSPEALAFVSDRFEDPEEIRGELKKLSLAFYEKPLSLKEVTSLSVDEGEKDLLHFLDALCYGKTAEALRGLKNLRARQPFLFVLTSLYNRARVGMYMALYPGGSAREEALRSIGARNYQIRMGQEIVRRYPRKAIFDFMARLAFLSVAEKAGVGPGWRGLEMGLLRFFDTLDKR